MVSHAGLLPTTPVDLLLRGCSPDKGLLPPPLLRLRGWRPGNDALPPPVLRLWLRLCLLTDAGGTASLPRCLSVMNKCTAVSKVVYAASLMYGGATETAESFTPKHAL